MAFYDYKCEGCGEVFELSRPIDKRDEPAECPKCGKNGTRGISSPAFSLKGGGWAKDGYGGSGSSGGGSGSSDGSYWPTGDDYRSGRVSKQDLEKIPTVGPDGKLRDSSGNVLAG